MKTKTSLALNLFRIGIIALAIFYYQKLQYASELNYKKEPAAFRVLDKSCRLSRGGSHIEVSNQGRNYRIEYYGKKCLEAKVGGMVMLYYDQKNDTFYVPNSPIYQRYVIGLIALLVLTFIPWQRLKERMGLD